LQLPLGRILTAWTPFEKQGDKVMKILLVAVAFATLVASPVLAQPQTADRCDAYFGTYWDGVAPYSSDSCPNPYDGTIWEGVAPY
jgi:hypothetical protein